MFLRLVFAQFFGLRQSFGDSVFTLRIGVRCVGSAVWRGPPRRWESQLCDSCARRVRPPGFVDNTACRSRCLSFKRTRGGRTAKWSFLFTAGGAIVYSTPDRVACGFMLMI